MRCFAGSARPGDWVVLTRTVKLTLTDHLLGGDAGVKRGARGVVVGASGWGSLDVRLDTGLLGGVIARVPTRHVRVVRRGGGEAAFHARTSRLNALRVGVAVALCAPFLRFTVAWFLSGGSKDGLLAALVEGILQGALDVLAFALANPLQALLYLAVVTAASRFALGR